MSLRGSEWHVWDLHIHTPGTKMNDQFCGSSLDEKWKKFNDKVMDHPEVVALGITDYFSLENFNFAKMLQQEKEYFKDKLLLPNIEMRMLPVTKEGKGINLNIVFDDKLPTNTIQQQFLDKMIFSYDGDSYSLNPENLKTLGRMISKPKNIDDSSALRIAIQQYKPDYSSVFKILKESKSLKGHYLVCLPNSSNDGGSGIRDDSIRVVRTDIYKNSDIILSGNSQDVSFFLGEKDYEGLMPYGGVKPCISSSDAHSIDTINVFPENKRTWIKAIPSFDGLKQIVYEPNDRVRIQENEPERKLDYYLIDSLELIKDEANTWNQTIKLNPSLNSIIGGRSTGKSTLLDVLAKKVRCAESLSESDDSNEAKRVQWINSLSDYMTVSWKSDKVQSNDVVIDYLPQGYMHKLAEDTSLMDDLIEKIIRSDTYQNSAREALQAKVRNTLLQLSILISELFGIQSHINEVSLKIKEKGNSKAILSNIVPLQNQYDSLANNSMNSKKILEDYEGIKKEILKLSNEVENLKMNKEIAEKAKTIPFVNELIKSTLIEMKECNSFDVKQLIAEISFLSNTTNSAFSDIMKKTCQKISNSIQERNEQIQAKTKHESFKEGAKIVKENQELKDISKRLDEEKRKHKEVIDLEEDFRSKEQEAVHKVQNVVKQFITLYSDQKQFTDSFSLEKDNLSVKAEIKFNEKFIKEAISNMINLKSHEMQSLVNDIINYVKESNEKEITELICKSLAQKIVYKSGITSESFINELFNKNWFGISYKVVYQNDEFLQMSPGKKAFVVLKLLLDFSTNKYPILIDQPEDSLDNRAIYNELVVYLREKKKERQIILVTHNPNIVVGADSELVIVANQQGLGNNNQNGVKFEYLEGALEETKKKRIDDIDFLNSQGIREHVCEILEGGIKAFEERENKYGFTLSNSEGNPK